MDLDALLVLFDAAATLKRLPRSGWLLRGVPQPESIADHSYGVALVALSLCGAVNASGELPRPLDSGRVLAIAVLHDLAESRLTDLPGPALKHLPRTTKHAAEASVLRELLGGVPGDAELLVLWEEYESGSSPEGRLVRDADRLEMMVQCLAYERAGSRGLDEFWATSDAAGWHYPITEELYGLLKQRRGARVAP